MDNESIFFFPLMILPLTHHNGFQILNEVKCVTLLCMAANGTCSLAFIDYVTTDRRQN